MSGAWALARLELRRRHRGVIALAVLVGLFGAAVVAPLIGARRTVTAYDRLVRASDSADVLVSSPILDPFRLPWQGSSTVDSVRSVGAFIGRVDSTKDWMYLFAGPDPARPGVRVAGRWWSVTADDEVVISAVTAKNTGLAVGDLLAFSLYTPEQFLSVADLSYTEPAGPPLRLRVVGVIRLPEDAHADPTAKNVWAGPAFYLRHGEAVSIHNAAVRLRRGLRDLGAFPADLARALEEHASATGISREDLFVDQDDRAVQREAGRQATRVATTGLLVFAGVAGIVGLVVLAQIYRRQTAVFAEDQAVLHAVGFDARQRLAALASPGLVAALLSSVATVVGAVALSPLFPIGRAADLEPHPGLELNVALLVLGTAGWTVLVAVVAAVVAAAEMVRTSPRRSAVPGDHRLAGWARAAGASAPLALGVQFATDPRSDSASVPVRSTLAGTTLAVAGLLAVATFAVGLRGLLDTPARFGLGYDITLETSTADMGDMAATLQADPEVAGLARLWQATVQVEGQPVESYAVEAVKGMLTPLVVSGRLPSAGEIALGPRLLRSVAKNIGDDVAVTGPLGVNSMRIVGTVLSPQERASPFNGEMVLTPQDQSTLVEPGQRFPELTVRFASRTDQDAKIAELDARYPFGVIDESRPHRPSEIAQLAQLRPVLVAVGVLFACVLAGSVAHGVVVMAQRRRRDLALLRALGFSPRHLRLLIRASAATVAVSALVVGLPLGILAGGVAWSSVASSLDLSVPQSWPIAAIVLSVPGLILYAATLAAMAVRPALSGPVTGGLRRD